MTEAATEAKLPSFCAELPWEGRPGKTWLSYWFVFPSGDDFIDHCCGDCLGAEALQYARKADKPEFVDAVVLWMNHLRWLEAETSTPSSMVSFSASFATIRSLPTGWRSVFMLYFLSFGIE